MSKPVTFEYQQTLTQRSKNPQNKGINSHLHLVALKVSEYVGEPQKFAMWLGTHVQGVPSTSREFSRPSFLIPEVCAKIRPLKKLKNFLGGKFFALVSMR